MTGYILRRLGHSLPVLVLTTLLIFMLVHLLPGDPALTIAGPDADPTTLAAVRERLGLDRPLWVQYANWLTQVVRGNFGTSYVSGLEVSRLVMQAFPATLELALTTLVVMVAIAIPAGLTASLYEDGVFDRLVSGIAAFLIGVPNFWLAILLILLFSVNLQWLPPSGRVPLFQDPGVAARFLALPVLALVPRLASILTLFVRTSSLEVLTQDYSRTARAKGLSGQLIASKHVLRNALLPIITVLSVQFAQLLSGAVVIETVFAWPGMGRLLITAVSNRDYPTIQIVLLLFVTTFVLINVLTDLLYGLADPRLRTEA